MIKADRLALLIIFAFLITYGPVNALADTSETTATPAATRLNINQIQKKYLNSNSNEIQIVQNRKFPKANKFEFGLNFGMVSADPFLNDTTLGGFLGYHFSEFWGVRAFYWKDNTSKADSWYAAQSQSNVFVNTNAAQSYLGGEAKFVPIYGKLSLMGTQIIYFDFNLFAGAGIRKTQSGSSLAPEVGFGQQFYFSKYFVFGIDYRLMHYSETLIDQQSASPTYGQSAGTRTSFTHNILLSLSLLI